VGWHTGAQSTSTVKSVSQNHSAGAYRSAAFSSWHWCPCMKTALFFNGRKFYSGWRERALGKRIRFSLLADWLLAASGGGVHQGSYYFTGIDTGDENAEGAHRLSGFLHMLQNEPGFFVRRFPREARPVDCSKCATKNRALSDRALEISFTSEILTGAARRSFDQVVLVSPDTEHAIIASTLAQLGCRTFVASWGQLEVSALTTAAYASVDLMRGLAHFEEGANAHTLTPASPIMVPSQPVVERVPSQGPRRDPLEECFQEIVRAENKFAGGYLGLSYFVTRWRAPAMDADPDVRRRLIDDLVLKGRAEIYASPDGMKALRAKA